MTPATPANGGREAAAHLQMVPTQTGRPRLTLDGFRFRDPTELVVYSELRRVQGELPQFTSIGIFPNACVRVRGRTVEVDFLVTYQRRCGVIEVDGASHYRKWASDHSRDRLLEDSGVCYVDRIDAIDTAKSEEVETFVRRFLDRLTLSPR
jgi:hypothetical protein